ncbi:MAG: hypothetical protein A4E27_00018 [Methanobacterium sp. PtaU1.Bin242]|nr:MAG: hypothetical protein A4E27_00018 [Methanobacterium sp. PtaU1.Bin242]
MVCNSISKDVNVVGMPPHISPSPPKGIVSVSPETGSVVVLAQEPLPLLTLTVSVLPLAAHQHLTFTLTPVTTLFAGMLKVLPVNTILLDSIGRLSQ